MDSTNATGRRRNNICVNAEDNALDQITKEVCNKSFPLLEKPINLKHKFPNHFVFAWTPYFLVRVTKIWEREIVHALIHFP